MNELERFGFNFAISLRQAFYRDLADETELDEETRYKIVLIHNTVMTMIDSPFAKPVELFEDEVQEEYVEKYGVPVTEAE